MEAAAAQGVGTLGQGAELEMVWPMKEVEEVVVEALFIFQILAPPLQATQASFVPGCTLQFPPAPLSLQEVQAQINTFPQFCPPLS